MKNLELITTTMLLMMYLLGCSSKNNVIVEDDGQNVLTEQRKLIVEHIKDAEKRTKLLTIVNDIESNAQTFFNFYEAHNKKIAALNKNYTAARRDFEKQMAEFNDAYETYLYMLVQKRSEMKSLTNREEWALIMDRESTFIPE